MDTETLRTMSARQLADHIAKTSRDLSLAASYLKDKPGLRRFGDAMETALARISIRADDIAKKEASR